MGASAQPSDPARWPLLRSTNILGRLLPELELFGIVRVYNPNSWITILMTRIVGKIYENTKENKENKGAASGRAPEPRPGGCFP